ncbi:MAG: thioredoxin [Elusimicrobiota bacterium]
MSEIELNEQNFGSEVTNSSLPVLVDFWAPWCGPCKMIAPVIREIAAEYAGKLKVGKVNTDENMSISSQFQITSIPTLIIFKNGKPFHKIVGFKQKTELKKIIDNAL